MKKEKYKYNETDKQIKILNRITDKVLKQIEKERDLKQTNYIEEWFRYKELVSQRLKKYLN